MSSRGSRRRLAERTTGLLRRPLARSPRVAAVLRRAKRWFVRPSSPVLARVIHAFARADPDAFFVQVGSNDGIGLDPLRDEIVARRWSGVMIEPIPYVFERLRRNYEGFDRVHLENVAIADHDGTLRLYYLPERPGDGRLPEWYDALASFDREIILRHRPEIPDVDERIEAIDVPCVTLDSLCRRLGITRIDLLHTDTEGYDFQVIRSIDLERMLPSLLIFEHYHMDRATYDACTAYLRSFGYEHVAAGMDTICLSAEAKRHRYVRRLWRRVRAEPELLAFRGSDP